MPWRGGASLAQPKSPCGCVTVHCSHKNNPWVHQIIIQMHLFPINLCLLLQLPMFPRTQCETRMQHGLMRCHLSVVLVHVGGEASRTQCSIDHWFIMHGVPLVVNDGEYLVLMPFHVNGNATKVLKRCVPEADASSKFCCISCPQLEWQMSGE